MNATASTNASTIDQVVSQMGGRRTELPKNWAAPGLIWLRPTTKDEQSNDKTIGEKKLVSKASAPNYDPAIGTELVLEDSVNRANPPSTYGKVPTKKPDDHRMIGAELPKNWAAPGLIWLRPTTKDEQSNDKTIGEKKLVSKASAPNYDPAIGTELVLEDSVNRANPPSTYGKVPTKKPDDHRMIGAVTALAMILGYGGYKVVPQNVPETQVTSSITYEGVW